MHGWRPGMCAGGLVIPNDPLALSVVGKKRKLARRIWLEFAEYCGMSEKTAVRVLEKHAAITTAADTLIDACFLPVDQKSVLSALIADRTANPQGK